MKYQKIPLCTILMHHILDNCISTVNKKCLTVNVDYNLLFTLTIILYIELRKMISF